MRTPRFPWRSPTTLVAVALLVVATLAASIFVAPRLRSEPWSGGKDVPLEVVVVDDGDGRPVSGATVRLDHSWGHGLMPPALGATRGDGRVGLTAVSDARGVAFTAAFPWDPSRPVVIRKTERLSPPGGTLDVSAAGYERARVRLDGRVDRPAVVRLRKLPAGESLQGSR